MCVKGEVLQESNMITDGVYGVAHVERMWGACGARVERVWSACEARVQGASGAHVERMWSARGARVKRVWGAAASGGG